MANQVLGMPGVKEIADGIFLYTTRVDSTANPGAFSPPTFVYEVESVRPDRRGIRVTIDFSGSTNAVILTRPTHKSSTRADDASVATREHAHTSGDAAANLEEASSASLLCAEVSAQAFCRVVVARVTMRDPKAVGTIRSTYRWELLEPVSPESLAATVERGAQKLQHNIDSIKPLELAGEERYEECPVGAQTKALDIAKRCRLHGVLYVDQNFTPTGSSLGPALAGKVIWRRPRDFPGVFSPSLSHNPFGGCRQPRPDDVRPCSFAVDNSFSCAMAALAERPHLVSAALCKGGQGEPPGYLSYGKAADKGVTAADCHPGEIFCRGAEETTEECLRKSVAGGGDGGPKKRALEWAARKMNHARRFTKSNSETVAGAGMFVVRILVEGIWKELVLDDFFPCQPVHDHHSDIDDGDNDGARGQVCSRNGGPCLSRTHSPALWVSMLEKGYARAIGSYSAVIGGVGCGSGTRISCAGGEGEINDEGVCKEKGTNTLGNHVVAGGVIARPAHVLAMFTGAPVLQVMLDRHGERGEVKESTQDEERRSGYDDHRQAAGELWERMVGWVQEGWLVCLSTAAAKQPHEDNANTTPQASGIYSKDGLRFGYSYTLLDTANVGGGKKLMCLRGPVHPERGWTGAWVEDSPLWTPEILARLSRVVGANKAETNRRNTTIPQPKQGFGVTPHGAFWISIHEAVEAFVEVGVCMLGSGKGPRRDRCAGAWAQESRQRLSFVRKRRSRGRNTGNCAMADGDNAGVHSLQPSTMYMLSVYETSRMFFSLHQESNRHEVGDELVYHDAGVTVLRVRDAPRLQAVASTGQPAQATVTAGAVLNRGRYLIVPTCTGCIMNKKAGVKRRRDEPLRASLIGRGPGNEGGFTAAIESMLAELFDSLDADCDGVLCREELDDFLRITEGLQLMDEVYDWLVGNFSSCPRPSSPSTVENSTDSGNRALCLTRRGFVQMYRCMWQAAGRDLSVIRRDLSFGGIGDDLCPAGKRLSAILSVHADTRGFDIIAQALDPAVLAAALTLPVKQWGRKHVSLCSDALPRKSIAERDARAGSSSVFATSPYATAEASQNGDTNSAAWIPGQGEANHSHKGGDASGDRSPKAGAAKVNADQALDVADYEAKKASEGILHDRRNAECAVEKTDNGNGVFLFVATGPERSAGDKAVTFVVENMALGTDSREGGMIRAALDCTGSTNVAPMPGTIGLKREVVLLPGECQIVQNLVPANPKLDWSWTNSPLVVTKIGTSD